ncbi:hypothetical protein GCM10010440_36770 [Kitasatospora cinereorecta]
MTHEQPALFVADGTPSELDVLLMTEALGPSTSRGGQSDLALPFRLPSHFSIGAPVVTALTEEDAPASMREQFGTYDFHQVQLTCSFQAAPGCHFADARFAVTLSAEAIAYDLFPVLLEDARTVTLTRTGPTLSFEYNPMGATLTMPSYERAEEKVRYCSRIVAFDLRGDRPSWSFHRTDQHEITGPQRLFMIVRKPRGHSVQATFNLRARVQFALGGDGFSPVELVMLFRKRERSGEIVDEPSVALC